MQTMQPTLGQDALIIDSFAGGGGASTGLEAALGRAPDIAVNHNESALEMHALNHPETLHLLEDVWTIAGKAQELTEGMPVDVLWASPDCRHFSRAKGGAPVSGRVRGLAWTVLKWIKEVRPRVIFMENVPEFEDWGPIGADGKPVKSRKGETYQRFLRSMRGHGYRVETRVLAACDFGVPTTRRRWYLVARCDGQPIGWPEQTHSADSSTGLKPYVGAHTIIDWSVPGRSIFGRKKPLAEASQLRIAKGMKRYVFEAGDDAFIIRTGHASSRTGAGMTLRGQRLDAPLGTVCAGVNDKALVIPWVAQYFGGEVGKPVSVPLPTITNKDHHALVSGIVGERTDPRVEEVRAFLTKYYGDGTFANAQSLNDPCHTITAKARLGLVEVHGRDYQIVDITLRMLEPHELAAAQGFPEDYALLPTKKDSIAKIGNSVCPRMAELIAAANS